MQPKKTFAYRNRLNGSGIWLKRHLSEKVERESVLMEKILPMAKANDLSAVILPGNQLRFQKQVYDIRSVHRSGLPVHTLHERENENAVCFQGMLSPLSNFHACNLRIDETKYCSIEQYYQAEKAKRHGDQEVLSRILLETDPVTIKRLAKGITKNPNISLEEDNNANLQVLEKGLLVKFREPYLKHHLLQTGTKSIAEASAYDLFYGTGHSLYDKDCLKIGTSKGQNRMGKLLVKVRESLKVD